MSTKEKFSAERKHILRVITHMSMTVRDEETLWAFIGTLADIISKNSVGIDQLASEMVLDTKLKIGLYKALNVIQFGFIQLVLAISVSQKNPNLAVKEGIEVMDRILSDYEDIVCPDGNEGDIKLH